jgi:L-threonylcarbamoyladenylate synthase
MIRLSVDATEPDPATIRAAAACIALGGVVAYPTDTLYGLAADPYNPEAVRHVFAIKGRPDDKPLTLIAGSLADAEAAGRFTPLAWRLAAAFWPGPLTIVVVADDRLATTVHHGTGAVGIRVPDHAVARALALASGGVVTATSANRSGSPPSDDPAEVANLEQYELTALIEAGRSPGGPPSTIVEASGEVPVLVREGAVAWDRVLESLRVARAD